MLNKNQEEELADLWRYHPGLYHKSNQTYRRKEKKDRLTAEASLDAKMLAGWMKSMRTM